MTVSCHINQIPFCRNQRQISTNLNNLFHAKTRRILAQLRTGKSPILMSYLNAMDPKSYPSPSRPLCKSHDHTTQHLFSSSSIYTTLTPRDLWDESVGTAALLQQWADAMQAAGGGSGGSTP